MVEAGRTVAQAIAAGNYFEIRRPGWGQYAPPAGETPAEVLECAKQTFRNIRPGMEFEVIRIVGGNIGCRWVEPAGTITA